MKRKHKTALLQTITYLTGIATGAAIVIAHTPKVSDRYYTSAAIVTEVNYEEDYIVADNYCRTFFVPGVEDWAEDDIVSVLIDSKNTDTILDDEIVSSRYVRMDRENYDGWVYNNYQK